MPISPPEAPSDNPVPTCTEHSPPIHAENKNTIGTFKGLPLQAPKQTDGAWFITPMLGLNWNEAIGKLTEAQKVTLRKEVPGFIEAEKVAIDGNPVLVFYRFNNF